MLLLQSTGPPRNPMPSPATIPRLFGTSTKSTTPQPNLPNHYIPQPDAQSMPPPRIAQAPQQPTKPENFGPQPASNIMLHELTKTRTAYNKSKQFRKPVPNSYKQINATTTLQFHDTMFQTTTTIEQTTPSSPPPIQNAHDAAIRTIVDHALQYSPPRSPISQNE